MNPLVGRGREFGIDGQSTCKESSLFLHALLLQQVVPSLKCPPLVILQLLGYQVLLLFGVETCLPLVVRIHYYLLQSVDTLG